MKNKVLAGVCLVAGALGVMAPALPQAQDEASCEKWCTKRGKSMCCPGYERGGAATSGATGQWYESDVQRCQTILQQPNIDPDSELMNQFQNCQDVKKKADADEAARQQKLEEVKAAKAALRQGRQPVASPVQAVPSLGNLPEVNANFTNLNNFGAQPGEMPVQPLATE